MIILFPLARSQNFPKLVDLLNDGSGNVASNQLDKIGRLMRFNCTTVIKFDCLKIDLIDLNLFGSPLRTIESTI